ncbi:MAG: InlB B-repeat-containing protein, partial [Candidatus Riflebacteria bacterium]|nr:InlB B-repeat-containing protein [Candidatus Riflebacteria bacterium]
MRLNSNSLFRNIFLLMALISSLLLTACGGGGGGGGSTAPATQTANVKVIIPGSLFPQQAKEVRAATSLETLTLKVVAYSNGKEKTDVKITDRKATSNGIDFIASVDGLLNVYDYRFKVFHKNVELLSNQVDDSEIVNDANITINIETSYKTIAYDSWLKKKPTNASMKNFKANSKSAGFTKDADYKKLTLQVGNNNYTADQYQENLIKAAKGESSSLPTGSTAKINVDKITTTDKETVTFTISYNLDGGTVSKTNPTKYDSTSDTITLNNPTKDGYDFTGWTGSNGNTPQTTVTIVKGTTGNKTYTANWTKKNNHSLEISSIASEISSGNIIAKSAEQQFVVNSRGMANYFELIAKMLDKSNEYSAKISSIRNSISLGSVNATVVA